MGSRHSNSDGDDDDDDDDDAAVDGPDRPDSISSADEDGDGETEKHPPPPPPPPPPTSKKQSKSAAARRRRKRNGTTKMGDIEPPDPTKKTTLPVIAKQAPSLPLPSAASAAVAAVRLQPSAYDEMCCGPQCGVCCGCPATRAGCWMRVCNHRDNVRAYIGSYLLTALPLAAVTCVLFPAFLILWAIEDTSTASSVALSWNSHIVFTPMYCICLIGIVTSIYQHIQTRNKSYMWAVLWFSVLLTSAVFYRQSRDQELDEDPILFRAFRYTAWLLFTGLFAFSGIVHCFHLFSGRFAEVSQELKRLSKPGILEATQPTTCQYMCGPRESVGSYLSSMAISKPGVFIPVFLLWMLFLIGKFFEDVTPVTIESFSSFDDALRAHAIVMPLYADFILLMVTGVVDVAVYRDLAHIWAVGFFAAMGSGIALIRHSNIHANDEDRLTFDALRISGWTCIGVTATLFFILHAVRVHIYRPIVEQIDRRDASADGDGSPLLRGGGPMPSTAITVLQAVSPA